MSFGDFERLDKLYVRRDSAEYQSLLEGMKDLAEIKLAMIGGFDSGGKYRLGILSWVKFAVVVGTLFMIAFTAVFAPVIVTIVTTGRHL